MTYSLILKENLEVGVKRVLTEQVEVAIENLSESQDNFDEAIHASRKAFKKVRAVTCLIAKTVGKKLYKKENIFYRDMGRNLAIVRGQAAMLEAIDNLNNYADTAVITSALSKIKQYLLDQKNTQKTLNFKNIQIDLQKACARVEELPLKKFNFIALCNSVKKAYSIGRKSMQKAYKNPKVDNLHEWRKQVKTLWYYMRLLEEYTDLKDFTKQLNELGEYLGQDHDLAELLVLIKKNPLLDLDKEEYKEITLLIAEKRTFLQIQSWRLGEWIYTEKPKIFIKLFQA